MHLYWRSHLLFFFSVESLSEENSKGLKQGWMLLLSLRRQQCVWLAWSAMWTSDSSHTCSSTQTNTALMEVRTVVKLGSMATDILLWCGGVHEGRHSQQNVTSWDSGVSLTSSRHQTHQWQHATTHAGDCTLKPIHYGCCCVHWAREYFSCAWQ